MQKMYFKYGGAHDASKNHHGLYRMQAEKLWHHEEQEEQSRQTGNEQVLQILQEAHRS